MKLSAEEAFVVLGCTASCTPRELRRRYATLARRWHPDRVAAAERGNATTRMAAINAAYRVAKLHLRRPPAPKAKSSPPPATVSAVVYVRPFSLWRHEPGTHEWRGLRAVQGIGIALVAAGVADFTTRLTPEGWLPVIWILALTAAVGTVIAMLRRHGD